MWFTAAAQIVGQELQAQPLDLRNPYAQAPAPFPWATVGLVAGGLAALAGIYWVLR